MIQTNGLTKQLGGRTVVSDVTFRCEPGTVTGFLGPNGAGKTTTLRMVMDILGADAGTIEILGRRQALRRGRMEILGPLGQQHQPGLPGCGPGYVADDAGQPRAEPVRVAQPAQARERLQERLLHDVIHVVPMRVQPRRERPRRRKVPLNQQRERASITGAGPPDQLTVADVHTGKCQPGVPRLPASAVRRSG